MERKPLTKSLHTVTAAVNVAAYLATQPASDIRAASRQDRLTLANAALGLLGYGNDWTLEDATCAMIVKQLRKLGLGVSDTAEG